MPRFTCTKTYGHDIGLSCVFRQPKATSHCRHLHGYALAFEFTFACDQLDDRNWVVDFGGLKELRRWLERTFDHTVIIAEDDPKREILANLEYQGLAQIVVCVNGVGIERFAEYAFLEADTLVRSMTNDRAWVQSVKCSEHGANSATYHI